MTGSVADWITAGATVALAVGAVIALRQVVELKRDRHARLRMVLMARWDGMRAERREMYSKSSEQIREIVERGLRRDFALNDRETYDFVAQIPEFFEDVGVLVGDKALTAEAINKNLGADIVRSYNRWREAIDWIQDQKVASNFEHFESLAAQVAEIRGVALERSPDSSGPSGPADSPKSMNEADDRPIAD
jgi:hypothetical protein